MKNKYIKRAKISERKFREVLNIRTRIVRGDFLQSKLGIQ